MTTLYCFKDADTKIKIQIIKTKIIPILTYPPIPTQALSITAISTLQKVQNVALRFLLAVRRDDYRTSRSLHEEASITALKVRLQQLATGIWEKMADEGWDLFPDPFNLHLELPDTCHQWFPRSLQRLAEEAEPEPRYL